MADTRWIHGMNGWRVRSVYESRGVRTGEITGWSFEDERIWVVFDGDENPTVLCWDEVRPA